MEAGERATVARIDQLVDVLVTDSSAFACPNATGLGWDSEFERDSVNLLRRVHVRITRLTE